MHMSLESVIRLEGALVELSVVICTDSQAALVTMKNGAGAQTTALGADVWRLLVTVTETGRHVYL